MRRALVALLLAAPAGVAAQAPAPAGSALPRPFWLNVGLVGSDEMIGLGASVTVARSASRIVTVRATALEEMSWWWVRCAAPPDQRVDVGVLYGVATQSRWVLVSASAGLGVAAIRETTYEPTRTERSLAPAVPVEGQIFFRPFRNVGLGATVMANLNHVRPFTAVLVGLQLGRLTPPWPKTP